MWQHVAGFLPLGILIGFAVAQWSARLIAYESGGTRKLGRAGWWGIVAANAILYTVLVLAVTHGRCQWITEGGSINWGHWRMLYHDTLIALLLTATAIDLDQYLIPDEITIPGTLFGLGVACVGNMQLMQVWVDWNKWHPLEGPFIPHWIKTSPHWHGLAFSLCGIVAGAGITWGARAISQWVLRVEALGFGDVTLMAMIGSFLGWQPVICVFLIAPICGITIGVAARLMGGRRALPYGPFLSLAAVIVLLTWQRLWEACKLIFGHWPTLVGIVVGMVAGMAFLLGILRLYRAIPVDRMRADDGTAPPESLS